MPKVVVVPPIIVVSCTLVLMLLSLLAKIVSSSSNAMQLLHVNLISDLQLVDANLMVPMLINLEFCC